MQQTADGSEQVQNQGQQQYQHSGERRPYVQRGNYRGNQRGGDRGGDRGGYNNDSRGNYRSQRGGYNNNSNQGGQQRYNNQSQPQFQQDGQQQRQPMPMPMANPMMQQSMPQASLPLISLPQVDISQFQQMQDPADRKNWVGHQIYPVILKHVGEGLAAKITGMVIDESAVNLPLMLQDQSYFNKNINDAFQLLGGHAALAQAQQQQAASHQQ